MALAVPALATGCSDDDPCRAGGGGEWDLVFHGVAGGQPMLFRAAANGSETPVLIGGGFVGIDPHVLPDDSRTVFQVGVRPGDRREIAFVFPTMVTAPTVFLGPIENEETADAELSPDGLRIAYASTRDDGLFDVFVAALAFERLDDIRNLTPPPLPAVTLDRYPAWSPDGSRIVFSSNRNGTTKLWIMNADGSDPRQLTTDLSIDTHPSWSPDGTQIAYQRMNEQARSQVAIVAAAGGEPRILDRPGEARTPRWSPDGTQIALASNADGTYDIYCVTPEGEELARIVRPGEDLSPAWVKRAE